MGDYAIMDNKGIIEDGFNSEEETLNNLDRVRKENKDITGDLKVIKILSCHN